MNEGGEMKIYCPVCNWVVISLPALEDHMKQHRRRTESVLYRCPYCPYSTDKATTLIGHQRSHADEKLYKCWVCDEVFTNSGDYCSHQSMHMMRARRRKSIVPLPRDVSSKKRIHAGERPYHCNVCGVDFTQSQHLLKHQRIHMNEKPYVCALCGKAFVHPSTLVIHTRVHTGEKPYKCATCGKSFTQSGTLGIHKRTHTGERPYTCDVCGRSFAHLGTLHVHKRTHAGGRPFTCPTRGKTSSEAGSLRACRQARAGSSASTPPARPLRRCAHGRAGLHEGVTAAGEVVASLGGEGLMATPSATPSASLSSEHGETLSFETLPRVKVECDGEDPSAALPIVKRERGRIASFETWSGVKVECDGEDPSASLLIMKQEWEESPGCETRLG